MTGRDGVITIVIMIIKPLRLSSVTPFVMNVGKSGENNNNGTCGAAGRRVPDIEVNIGENRCERTGRERREPRPAPGPSQRGRRARLGVGVRREFAEQAHE